MVSSKEPVSNQATDPYTASFFYLTLDRFDTANGVIIKIIE